MSSVVPSKGAGDAHLATEHLQGVLEADQLGAQAA